MGLALHEMAGGYVLLKLSDASLYVISLLLLSGERFSKLTLHKNALIYIKLAPRKSNF